MLLLCSVASGHPGGRTSPRAAVPGRPTSGRGWSAIGADAPARLRYCILPFPVHLARLLLPSRELAAALGTPSSAPRSRDGRGSRAEPAQGRGPCPHVPRGQRWGPGPSRGSSAPGGVDREASDSADSLKLFVPPHVGPQSGRSPHPFWLPPCLAQSRLQTHVRGSEKRVTMTPLGSRSRLGSLDGETG